MTNAAILPLKADFRAIAKAGKAAKDPTAALRQKRARAKRKNAEGKMTPKASRLPSATVTAEKLNEIKPTVTVGSHASTSVTPRPLRTSWSLVMLACGFAALGVLINVWNAWSAGNAADTALPAAMGILAEGVVFFLPARAITLPTGRRVLAFCLLLFVSAFALTNGLRMASIIAADQAAARADRQTVGVQTADRALDAAEAERDKACSPGHGRSFACKARQAEVTRLEAKQSAAVDKVAAEAKPEATDFAGLVTWVTAGAVQPGDAGAAVTRPPRCSRESSREHLFAASQRGGNDMRRFNVGQRVVCVDNALNAKALRRGALYTVRDTGPGSGVFLEGVHVFDPRTGEERAIPPDCFRPLQDFAPS